MADHGAALLVGRTQQFHQRHRLVATPPELCHFRHREVQRLALGADPRHPLQQRVLARRHEGAALGVRGTRLVEDGDGEHLPVIQREVVLLLGGTLGPEVALVAFRLVVGEFDQRRLIHRPDHVGKEGPQFGH